MTILPQIIATLSSVGPGGLPQPHADPAHITSIINIVLEVAGALALLMVTVSGLRYILSAGDTQKVARAKDSLIYSMVGLAIAISARAIVALVVDKL